LGDLLVDVGLVEILVLELIGHFYSPREIGGRSKRSEDRSGPTG
jgi:hypothetical protein